MATPSDKTIIEAVEALINSRTWSERRLIIEAKRDILLTDAAEQVLNNMIQQPNGDADSTQILEECSNLLVRSQQVGIESAFAEHLLFEDIQTLLNESERLTSPNDLPRKVEIYCEALGRIDHNTYPQLWAYLHASLATSLARDPWERLENLEQAILHFQQVLTV